MKIKLTLCLTVVCIGNANAALISNGSFELVSGVPFTENQLSLADSWAPASYGTPDLFHSSSVSVPGNSSVEIPVSSFGEQTPYDGEAYAGLIAYQGGPRIFREYIQAPLLTPLQAGIEYDFTFQVSLGEISKYAIDSFGAYFSTNAPFNNSVQPILASPQIENATGNILSDRLGWTAISGTFIASGGESFLTIGNFRDKAGTQTAATAPTTVVPDQIDFAYYFIDGVSLDVVSTTVPVPAAIWLFSTGLMMLVHVGRRKYA